MPYQDHPAAYGLRARRKLLGLFAGALMLASVGLPAHALARDPMPVVATFSILGDMVREIGGERVSLTTIVGRNSDPHNFEPTPQDAKALNQARVLVLNGLDFEAWLPRLLEASEFSGVQVLASAGVKVRHLGGADHDHGDASAHNGGPDANNKHHHDHGDVDPHAWQDLSNGIIYAHNIANGLARADPRNANYYQTRVSNYVARMTALDTEIRTTLAAIPAEHRRVISSHDAFGYFGDAYGVEFIPITALSSQAEPSAQDVAKIIRLLRETGVSGVFIENMSSPVLAKQIAREANAIMGGTLYADALGPVDEPASTYLGMFSWNAGRLVYVLRKRAGG